MGKFCQECFSNSDVEQFIKKLGSYDKDPYCRTTDGQGLQDVSYLVTSEERWGVRDTSISEAANFKDI